MARFKTFLLSFLIAALSIVFISGCSTDTPGDNLGGGNKQGVTPVNEFPAKPLALLGVYDITSQSVNGTSQEITAGSEFRVNVSTTKLGLENKSRAVDVLVRIIINGKTVEFTREVSLAGETLGNEFFEKIFTEMGAKVTGGYTLEFTLAGTQYTEIVDAGIISSGDTLVINLDKTKDTLVINLDKTKDLQMDAGLDDPTETPETPGTPSEPVKVESIQITTPEKSYYTGSTVTIDFTLNPSNTTETDVTYQTTYNGSGTVKAANGKGQLVLENVTQHDTVVFTIANNQQASFNIIIVNEVESINFLNAIEKIEQNQKRIIAIENYDVIKDAFSSITYSVVDGTKASINSTTGEVTGLKNGVTQVNVTAIGLDGQQLTAQYELDVVGFIDYNDASSLEGTYDIIFFGTNSNGGFLTKAVISNNCTIYKDLWGSSSKCPEGIGGYSIPEGDFAGKAIIKVSGTNLNVHTKVGFVGNGTIQSMAKNDQYQYTVYDQKTLDQYKSTSNMGNMNGRNLTATSNIPNTTYYFEQNKTYTTQTNFDLVLFTHFDNKQTSGGAVNPDTRLVLRKTSSKPAVMDPNTLDDSPFDILKDRLSLDANGNITVN